jgi:hypothetical protein
MLYEPIIMRSVDCDCDFERAAVDSDRRISSHRTSGGVVTYHRCFCGLTGLAVWRGTTDVQAS